MILSPFLEKDYKTCREECCGITAKMPYGYHWTRDASLSLLTVLQQIEWRGEYITWCVGVVSRAEPGVSMLPNKK